MSESLFIGNVLPSLVYPTLKLNIEQDEICKALLIKARNWMNSTEMLLVIYAHSWDFLTDS